MAIYAVAVQKPIVRNYGGVRPRTTCAILHVDAGGANSLQGWFNNPASSASSHFYVKYDGTVEQYVDTKYIAWTQRAGNAYGIGIETQGLGSGSWTTAQMASIAALLRWISKTHGVPLVDMRDSKPGRRGVGYHRMGIDNWRVTGGDVWGPRGKVCPGNARVLQFEAVLGSALGGTPVVNPLPPKPSETEAQLIARLNAGYSVAWIKAIQQKLNRLGGYQHLDEDGVRGAKTASTVKDFQARNGLVPDGLPGAATNAKLDQLLAPKRVVNVIGLQQAVRAGVDNAWGPDTDKRLETVRAASALGGGRFPYGVSYTQGVVGARKDGAWGPNSRKAHDATVAAIQRALGVVADGQWGPATEAAYQAARKLARNY